MNPLSARRGLGALAFAATMGVALRADPLAAPATGPDAHAPATTAATSPAPGAKKPTVDEILAARPPVAFHFDGAPITDIIDYIAKSYSLRVENQYKLTDLLTVQDSSKLTARQAIDIVDGAILPLGYTLVESVRGGPDGPYVVLTVVPTKEDAGRLVPVFRGNDPAAIPEDQIPRTQIMTLHGIDPDKARAMILAVVGKQAEITLNPSTGTLIITDTGAHVHTAAALLQTLDTPASPPPPSSQPAPPNP